MNNLINKKILISSGPTKAYIDPVRYISNASSGKMGLSLAIKARDLGCEVVVVSGETNCVFPSDIKVFAVDTNEQMLAKISEWFLWCDVFISAAAVTDFRVVNFSDEKIKKVGTKFCLELKQDVDILKTVSMKKRSGQIVVGFALETQDILDNAIAKLKNKNLDFIIANDAKTSIGTDTTSASILDKRGKIYKFDKMQKLELSENIYKIIFRE